MVSVTSRGRGWVRASAVDEGMVIWRLSSGIKSSTELGFLLGRRELPPGPSDFLLRHKKAGSIFIA